MVQRWVQEERVYSCQWSLSHDVLQLSIYGGAFLSTRVSERRPYAASLLLDVRTAVVVGRDDGSLTLWMNRSRPGLWPYAYSLLIGVAKHVYSEDIDIVHYQKR